VVTFGLERPSSYLLFRSLGDKFGIQPNDGRFSRLASAVVVVTHVTGQFVGSPNLASSIVYLPQIFVEQLGKNAQLAEIDKLVQICFSPQKTIFFFLKKRVIFADLQIESFLFEWALF